jgi:L-2,4-diaminobutyrate decarboxylase
VIPWQSPTAARAAWPADFPDAPAEDLVALLERTIAGSIRLHHPRYLGHQVPPPLPGSALVEALAALLNNGIAVYEMGGASTPMEAAVEAWMKPSSSIVTP